MSHELVKYPNEILTTKCEEVKLPLSKLAAPQFGVTKRMFVIRIGYKDVKLYLKMVNPRIVVQDKTTYMISDGEACLSEPGLNVMVPRAKKILLMGYDAISNKNITLHLEKFAAAVVQHEFDHLEGKLLHDYQKENVNG